jgi:hypothetical protein
LTDPSLKAACTSIFPQLERSDNGHGGKPILRRGGWQMITSEEVEGDAYVSDEARK